MANLANRDLIEQEIKALNRQYEESLKNGDQFSVLREIRDRLRILQSKLSTPDDQGTGGGADSPPSAI